MDQGRSEAFGVQIGVRSYVIWVEAFSRRSRGVLEAFSRRSRGVLEAFSRRRRVCSEGVEKAFRDVRVRSEAFGKIPVSNPLQPLNPLISPIGSIIEPFSVYSASHFSTSRLSQALPSLFSLFFLS